MKPKKHKNEYLEAYKKIRKTMPKPTRAHDTIKYKRDKAWKVEEKEF